MVTELERVISEMYSDAFDCEQAFDFNVSDRLHAYADELTKILKDNEGDKNE